MFIVVVAVVAGVAALSHLAPFPFLLDAVAGDAAVWRLDGQGQRTIYLTFDDGPNPAATPQLLDVLREERIRATFFLIDEHVTGETAPLVRRMFQEGHSVAQHSGNRWLMLHSPARLAGELESAGGRIQQLAGSRPCRLFRPHAGWRSITLFMALRRSGYKLAGWSWFTWDWLWFRKRTGERVAHQVLSHAAPGKIVVLHDGHHKDSRPDRQYTIDAVRRIVPALRAQGYNFGSLCDALR